MRIKTNNVYLNRYVIVSAIITYLGLSVKLNAGMMEIDSFQTFAFDMASSFYGFSIPHALLLPGLILLYGFISGTKKTDKKERVSCITVFVALLFALFVIVGTSFEYDDSLRYVIDFRTAQPVKALIMFLGYAILLYYGVDFFFNFVGGQRLEKNTENQYSALKPVRWYNNLLLLHPFKVMLLTLIVFYIPYLIISFPAVFMGDTWQQLAQYYSELQKTGTNYLSQDRLLIQGVYLNQAHPIIHTLLLNWCVAAGSIIFKSWNMGLFIYSLIQGSALVISVSYMTAQVIKNCHLSTKINIIFPIYACIHPLIYDYIFLITKDVLYSCFFIWFMTNFFLYLSGKRDKKNIISLFLAGLGLILFRNEGRYILYIFFALLFIFHKQHRLFAGIGFIILFMISCVFFQILFPALGYTPGSIREPLSVPFQQTARYVKDHEDEVTLKEEETIDKILDFYSMADNYDPNLSDPVKFTYKENATREDIIQYFKVWFNMMLKHPLSYLEASLNNYYQYFYPGNARIEPYTFDWSLLNYSFTNSQLAPVAVSFSPPAFFEKIRTTIDNMFIHGFSNLPVISFLMTPAVYSWILLLCFFLGFKQNGSELRAFMLYPFIWWVFLLFGPVNGSYGRFLLPLILFAPALIPMTISCYTLGDKQNKLSE